MILFPDRERNSIFLTRVGELIPGEGEHSTVARYRIFHSPFTIFLFLQGYSDLTIADVIAIEQHSQAISPWPVYNQIAWPVYPYQHSKKNDTFVAKHLDVCLPFPKGHQDSIFHLLVVCRVVAFQADENILHPAIGKVEGQAAKFLQGFPRMPAWHTGREMAFLPA